MRREDVNEIGLAVLVVVAALLAAAVVWLQRRGERQFERLNERLSALEKRVDVLANPPPEPKLSDKVKDVYQKSKDAAVRQYEAMKSKLGETK